MRAILHGDFRRRRTIKQKSPRKHRKQSKHHNQNIKMQIPGLQVMKAIRQLRRKRKQRTPDSAIRRVLRRYGNLRMGGEQTIRLVNLFLRTQESGEEID